MFFGPKVDLTPQAFREALDQDGGKVVDCRTAGEASGGMIPGAVNVDWLAGEMQQASASWDKNEPIYCYCRSGARSGAAAQFLKQQGFNRVYNIGGYSGLR
jgi:phage shock protein E